MPHPAGLLSLGECLDDGNFFDTCAKMKSSIQIEASIIKIRISLKFAIWSLVLAALAYATGVSIIFVDNAKTHWGWLGEPHYERARAFGCFERRSGRNFAAPRPEGYIDNIWTLTPGREVFLHIDRLWHNPHCYGLYVLDAAEDRLKNRVRYANSVHFVDAAGRIVLSEHLR